jgi:MHS family proline/betaine transporter-like MFS transporter
MSISLLEEFLLLTLEDEGGRFDTVPEIFLTCGVAGAILMDLSLRGRIDSDLTSVWVVDSTPTGDAVLDQVLSQVAAEPTRLSAAAWLRKLSLTAPDNRQAAIERLCTRGILHKNQDGFTWVLKARRYPVLQGGELVEAKRRLMNLIFTTEIPTPHDSALMSLAASCHVFERILTPSALKEALVRINQVARLDLIGGKIAKEARQFMAELKHAERRAILGGMAGNIVEWYDFSIYGYFALILGPLFFPSDDPATTLMATFGVFALGLVGRPIGTVLIGHIADRINRRQALLLTVSLMMIHSFVVAVLPSYAQVGILAPLALLFMRFLQGIAVGGEYATSSVMLVEAALPSRRGFISSLSKMSAAFGMLLGSAVGAIIMATLPTAWGWRVAFLFGLVLGLVAFVLRRKLPHGETLAVASKARSAPIVEIFRHHWRTVLNLSGLVAGSFIGAYLFSIYLVTWLTENTELGTPTILLINTLALASSLFFTPLFSALSDRIGRKPLLMIGSLLAATLTVPLFMLMQGATAAVVLAAWLVLIAIMACMNGGSTVYLVQAFPPQLRTSGLAVSLTLAAVVFGGTLPVVAVWLTTLTGSALAPAWYFAVVALLTAVLAAPMPSLDNRTT